jgi:geranylgeranyl pyrophosphate synthase
MLERDLKYDLEEVNRLVRNRLSPWWEDIQNHVCQAAAEPTWEQLPAAVLAIYRYLGQQRGSSLRMAALFKMTHLASVIHESVRDDEDGQIYDRDMQFSILIGDYIYGSILKLLVEIGADSLLDVFSDTIGQINEGLVMKYKLDSAPEEILARTRASLYQAAFTSAARLRGLSPEATTWYTKLGFHMGMALEGHDLPELGAEMMNHCQISRDLFAFINQGRTTLSETALEMLILENLNQGLTRAAI